MIEDGSNGAGAEASGSVSGDDAKLRLATPAGRWVLTAAVLGSAVVSLDATVVNVALPTIGQDLDADVAGLQWTVNGYALTLAALILLGGSLGDRFGRRRVFVLGVAWFGVASLLCGVAPNLETLVLARALQGVGGALLTPGSLAMISASFCREDRARAIGAWSGLGGVASAVGPLLGGALLEQSWRWIFLINLPLTVFVIYLAVRHVPETLDASAPRRLDVLGSVTGAIGLGGVTYALIAAPSGNQPVVWIAGLAGVLGFVLFIRTERRSPHPLVPLDVFANRQFTAANLVTLALYAAISGVFFLLAVVLQVVTGLSPLQAGAAMLPVTLLMLTLSSRTGALAARIGPRRPMTVGPVIMAGGLLLMLRIEPAAGYFTHALPGILVFGLGLTLTVAPLTAAVLAAAEDRHAGVASGVNNAVARTAGLLSVAVLPLLMGLSGDDFNRAGPLADGFHIAVISCAVLMAVSALIAWLGVSDEVTKPVPARTEPAYHCAVDQPPAATAPAESRSPAGS
ncbi:MFS transporter [Kineosporia rhizophila]|uniref:MFS transporter n=1 Tax=Kineosporia rhizophila TaxID=84633 RepID=UPI001E61A4C4|nr:MFS transporter [Kineosporia rhizophila]MCE0540029.1 MFS transporter [Kineosporia rhizophila]